MARPGQAASDNRFGFVANYWDPQASLTKQFNLFYFPNDGTVEMVDLKTRKIFLKRCPCPALALDDLFIGSSVTVFSRQLKIVDFADEATRRHYASKTEGTLAIITPDGYEAMGNIFQIIYNNELRIAHMNLVRLSPDEASFLLEPHKAQSPSLMQQCASYPVILLHLVGENAVGKWLSVLGPAGIQSARVQAPNSVRALFAKDAGSTVALGSMDVRRAPQEIDFAFDPKSSSLARRNNASLNSCAVGVIK
eukprot:402504_1